jgi:hypothetical protein
MPHPATRWSALTLLVLLVHLPWLTTVNGQRTATHDAAASAPTDVHAPGSGSPAPQVDESAGPTEAPATF